MIKNIIIITIQILDINNSDKCHVIYMTNITTKNRNNDYNNI